MATANNLLLAGVSGALGKQIIVKQYSYGTVISPYPDMSKVKPTTRQKENRKLFREAHLYAQSINNDPIKKAAYQKKLKKGENVYLAALSEYMRKHKKV